MRAELAKANQGLMDLGMIAEQLRREESGSAIARTYEQAAKKAAEELGPLVGGMMAENWAAAGFGDTGHMDKVLRQCQVTVRVKGSSLSLMVWMPSHAAGYFRNYKSGGMRVVSPYTVAGALNYGAVRAKGADRDSFTHSDAPRPFGAKGKRTIKKLAFSGASPRALAALERGYTRKGVRLTSGVKLGGVAYAKLTTKVGRSVKFSNGVVALEGKKFFELNTTQRKIVSDKFADLILTFMSEVSYGR